MTLKNPLINCILRIIEGGPPLQTDARDKSDLVKAYKACFAAIAHELKIIPSLYNNTPCRLPHVPTVPLPACYEKKDFWQSTKNQHVLKQFSSQCYGKLSVSISLSRMDIRITTSLANTDPSYRFTGQVQVNVKCDVSEFKCL